MSEYTLLTFQERKEIKRLIGQGWNLSEIGRTINRGKNTIIAEVRRNGGPLFYEPVKAQERFEVLKKERIDRCKKMSAGQTANPYRALERRIQNLEMQIEILVDAIKERSHES